MTGKSGPSDETWDFYVKALERYAMRRIGELAHADLDPNGIAMSALRTFFRQKSSGEFRGANLPHPRSPDEDLLPYLRMQVRRKLNTVKRRIARRPGEQLEGDFDTPALRIIWEGYLADDASPAETADAYVEEAVATLREYLNDSVLLDIAKLKMQGYTAKEISEQIEPPLSPQAVHRRIVEIRSKLDSIKQDDE